MGREKAAAYLAMVLEKIHEGALGIVVLGCFLVVVRVEHVCYWN